MQKYAQKGNFRSKYFRKIALKFGIIFVLAVSL